MRADTSFQLRFENSGFIIRFSGDTCIDDLNDGNGAIQGHPEFDAHQYQVIDLREADLNGVSFEDTREPAAIDVVAAATNTAVRIALVPADALDHAICREFADQSIKMGSPWDYAVFYDYDEALAWARNGAVSGADN